MAQQRDLASDELATEAIDGPSLALARWLSLIFSPPLVTVAAYLLIAYVQPEPFAQGSGWVLLTLLVQMVPTSLLYLYRRHTGEYRDADVSVRHERNELYLVGSLSVLASIVVLNSLNAPPVYRAMAICTLGLGLVCGLVNLVWKISMHGTAIGTLATIGAIIAPTLGAVLWIIALAVGWARVRTRNHSPLQVLAGLVLAVVMTLSAFSLFGNR
ncbi:MAG: phosphatase PAP2 family protein [Roseiflexaceae bacterium]|nr:phosphatase PAP2 family protein [Roseiflexaceae bacterium]